MSVFAGDIEDLAQLVISLYAARGWQVATAESCTGGLIAGALTEISGSSAVVDRGFVTYSNAAKREMIGVDAATIATYGAVSRETALQMVKGALSRSRATAAVAVTGIAGPGGGSAEKPVGLVHIAAMTKTGALLHREMRYGDLGREAVRLATVSTALSLLVALAQA
jgi:nicotinamide-nucleotide amidase